MKHCYDWALASAVFTSKATKSPSSASKTQNRTIPAAEIVFVEKKMCGKTNEIENSIDVSYIIVEIK